MDHIRLPRRASYSCLALFVILFADFSDVQAQQAWPWEANKGKQASILLFGDTNIQDRDNPVDAFQHVLPTMIQADMRIVNLEGPFAGTSKDPRLPDIPHKERWKHSEPEMVKGLTVAGIDVVGVANNVTYPWMSLLKSLEVLRKNNIKYAGGGNNLQEAHAPVIVEKNGFKTGFLSYASTVFPFQHAATESIPGIASVRVDTYYKPVKNLDKPGMGMETMSIPQPEELSRMREDIRKLRSQADVVIISIHWGISDHDAILDYQTAIAHEAIEAGADIIMGHGNHMVGAVEVYKGKTVFYGLGNFVFDWEKMRGRKMEGMAIKVDVKNKKVDRISFIPMIRDDNNNVMFLDPTEGKGLEIIRNIQALTGELSELKIQGKEVLVTTNKQL
ncbi:capsule synthesis protein PGA_cap family protein [Flammeovirgaceae bacterium 311]|nr:capsule synthesis protein PGA_cap family protein [Flammeovirgaceae bacterium 311]